MCALIRGRGLVLALDLGMRVPYAYGLLYTRSALPCRPLHYKGRGALSVSCAVYGKGPSFSCINGLALAQFFTLLLLFRKLQ